MPNPYDKTTHDGKTVDWLTHQALLAVEKRLGYPLTIVQGSYHKGVGASAGTHDGGGVVDLSPWDWKTKVKAMRAVGFAAWHRPTLPGVWNEHIHAVLIGNARLSPAASAQVTAYRNGRNGLANNGSDDAPRPHPIPTFRWVEPPPPMPTAPGAIDLVKVSEQFLKAVEGRKVTALPGVKRIQRLLNVKLNAHLDEDGVVGPKTLNAWGEFERAGKPAGRPRVPDLATLTRLLEGSPYRIVGVTPPKPVDPPTPEPPPAPVGVRVDGVDLSHFQTGQLDYAAAIAAGVRFVYCKATEGTTVLDPMYAQRRAEVAAAGLRFGAYHFGRPDGQDGLAEARAFLAAAKPIAGDMRPMLDLEDDGGLSRAQLTAWVGAFVGEVRRVTGVPPFIYTPFDLDDNFDCPLWVARYNDDNRAPNIPQPWSTWTIWQFSDGKDGTPHKVDGIGAVDLDTLNTTEPAAFLERFRLPVPPRTTLTVLQQTVMPLGFSDHHSVRTVYGIDGTAGVFRNLTANVQHTDPAVQTAAEIKRLAQVADIIGWQEIETPEMVAVLKAQPGLEHFTPGGAGGAVPISWRADTFEHVASSSVQVHKGIAHVTPARYVNAVTLRHKATGALIRRVNTHVINGIEDGGLPSNLKRAPEVKASMVALARWVSAGDNDAVVWGGDLNIDYLAEMRLPASERCAWFPVRALGPLTTFDMPTVASHGRRLIDWTGHTDQAEAS